MLDGVFIFYQTAELIVDIFELRPKFCIFLDNPLGFG